LSGTDDDGEDEGEDEEDEETSEKKAKIKQFASEIKALESAIEKKRAGFTGGNPIMMVSRVIEHEVCA
jgi:transcription initiation factor TFIID subunit 7